MDMVARGEVWLVRFDPTIGSEIQKTRPAVVVSPPEIHDYLRTTIVAALTSKNHFTRYRIPLHFSGRDGLILLDQIRAVDKSRLIRKLGEVEPETLHVTLKTLSSLFAP